ncbi:hypothetical protein [Phytohabitans houttuyneae]|uniref:Uncharacterized protein n=1 Tax=Phytohabitans houttuyneae TaxID=1076126 RepID=A0A6V8KT24_9ACTN|nr:hypothetical protein [Phytohabitans houttuyneae]GFJ84957.1 hypothetical protein Phou_091370 [Phytohabitans houttuyneae]
MASTTGPQFRIESVCDAVKSVAADGDAPTLVTLTATGATVTGRADVWPGGAPAADAIGATLAGMARLIARHPAMFDPTVAGYGVILPAERVAFAADRTGTTHHIQLPGVPTEPLRPDRWSAICDGLTAMINAAR